MNSRRSASDSPKPADRMPNHPTSIDDRPVDLSVLRNRRMFIGLGAMKAGTTWVSEYLKAHPEVFHSPIKEMNFFNRLHPNPLRGMGDRLRQERMQTILLDKNWEYPPSERNYETLKTLAELGRLESTDDYLRYFARRVEEQEVFGEICPQYLTLPAQTYQMIGGLGVHVTLLLFLRDPTDRMASNIQHNLRRQDDAIDRFIDEIEPDNLLWKRGDYLAPFRNLEASGTDLPLEVFIYEDLFNEASVARLCNVLGITERSADFDLRANPSRGPRVSEQQKLRIREKLQPVYDELANFFGDAKPSAWRWTG